MMEELTQEVIEDEESEYVVFFHATWAPPSVDLFNEIRSNPEICELPIYLCIADEKPEWAKAFDIRGIPALVHMRSGGLIKRQTGYVSNQSFQLLLGE